MAHKAPASPEVNNAALADAAAAVDTSDLGARVRVHAIAKALKISSAAMIEILTRHGHPDKKSASTLPREAVVELLGELSAQKTPTQKAAAKKAAAKKTATKQTSAKKTTAKQAEAKKTAAKQTSAKKTTAKQAEAKKTAAKKAPAKKTATKQAEAKKTAAKKTAAKQAEPKRKSSVKKTAAAKDAVAQAGDAEQSTVTKSLDELLAESRTHSGESTAESQPRTRKVRRVIRRVGSRALASEHAGSNDQDASSATENSDQAEQRGQRGQRKQRGGTSDEGRASASQKNSGKTGKSSGSSKQQNDGKASRRSKTEQSTGGRSSTKLEADQLHPGERDAADIVTEPVELKGSTRLESRRRWRNENREQIRNKPVTRSEFLARRESVERQMVVRDSRRHDGAGMTTQIGVVEDGMLVEHFVTSENQQSTVGNIYLGRVQNVLAAMEAAFIDIGTGRNAVLYAGEMNWRSPHLHSKQRRIDQALRPGDQILVQVIKDPLGHKGARLTGRISFAGRYLVYFPGGATAGISRKLPESERNRLKKILARVIPGEGGAIIRTAAESVPEDHIAADVERLHKQWENLEKEEHKARQRKGAKPITLYEEPDVLIKVVRDLFNEDFTELLVDGEKSWAVVRDYIGRMAPDLKERVKKWHPEQHANQDVFQALHLDEQLTKALSRKVWLPSGGYLVIDRTEAMTVIDVNTGSFVGSSGNLEATVTENNLEAAEEIVRQMRLRDLGGMIVIDFIDMVLQENQDLVLRRLTEYLGRDRTRHKVSEVTSLGLVQITRKRLGAGLLETFATECEACDGRGVIVHNDPVETITSAPPRRDHGNRKERAQARADKRRREEAHERMHEQERQERDNQEARAEAYGEMVREDTESADELRAQRNAEYTHARAGDEGGERDAGGAGDDVNTRSGEGRGTRRSRRQRRHRGDTSGSVNQTNASATNSAQDTETTGKDSSNGSAESSDSRGTSRQKSGSRGPQRTGRRVIRRSAATTSDATISDIAAAAVDTARSEDPDEPSGENYVMDEKYINPPQPEKKRRIRRVVRRSGTDRATGVTGAAGSRDTAGRTRRANAKHSGDSDSPGDAVPKQASAGDMAQQQAEFDNSPRRKRRTRGNSRSDFPPTGEADKTPSAGDTAPGNDPHGESASKDTANSGAKGAARRNSRGSSRANSRGSARNSTRENTEAQQDETPPSGRPARSGRRLSRVTRSGGRSRRP